MSWSWQPLVAPAAAPTLVSIAVSPSTASVAIGAAQAFTALGTYSDSSTADVTGAATWTSSATGVATMSGATATGVSVGTSTITAAVGAVSGTAGLTVTAAVLSGTTLDAMRAGSLSIKWVASIEGYPVLLTDSTTSAVQAAYAGTPWDPATHTNATVLGGLFVELHNEQKIDPWDPFSRGGTCILRVQPDSTDRFGIDTHRRAHGAETSIAATMDRSTTAIPIAYGVNFESEPAEAHIGTECFQYSGVTDDTVVASQRGMYSPFKTGTGSLYFSNHHRVGVDPTGVGMAPILSQEPRTWIGKWVAVRMHTSDGTSINSRDDAALVFAGRIASIADDPETGCTVVELKHLNDVIADAVVYRDPWGAQCPDGVYTAGGTCAFGETYASTTATTTKIASTLSITAGRYAIDEICAMLSNWLGGELAAARIGGTYNWTINSSPEGYRTKCHYSMPAAASGTTIGRTWTLSLPREIGALLGFVDELPQDTGTSMSVHSTIIGTDTGTQAPYQGSYEPYRTLAFHFGGVEGLNYQMELENERGVWVDQADFLPTQISGIINQSNFPSDLSWGIFLIDEKALAFGAFDVTTHMLNHVYMAPWTLSTDDVRILPRFGRRYTDTNGPVTVRQVVMLEGSLRNLLAQLFYSTGTAGFNHATYDTLGFGLGIGIPGELLGSNFETSLTNLPQADMPAMLIIDEPTKIGDLLSADLMIRRVFPIYKAGAAADSGIIFHRWQTPIVGLAVADLTESNKAAPANSQENHRSASLESAEFQRPIVKIDYNRDFGFGRGEQYNASLQLEDNVAVDDGGNTDAQVATIKLRNVYSQFTLSGAALENLISDYLTGMPMFSRPARMITRSIDMRLWEGVLPGDIVTVTDPFARDPLTGMRADPTAGRAAVTRAATVVRLMYDPGGPSPDGKTVRDMTGEVDLFFLDTHRGDLYSPSALVDSSMNSAGFTAGYDSSTPALWFVQHQYSESTEDLDVSRFAIGDKIRITEVDPATTSAPLQWSRTIAGLPTADQIQLNTALSSPAFDSAKTYIVTYDAYLTDTTTQKDYAFQADTTTEMIVETDVASHYAATHQPIDVWTPYNGTEKAAFLADSAIGNGVPLDIGYDAQLGNLANQLIDNKTRRNSPMLWTTYPSLGAHGGGLTGAYVLAFCGPYFFGTELLTDRVRRELTIAPWFKLDNSASGTAGAVHIVISRECPIASAGEGPTYNSYNTPAFKDPYLDSASFVTWTTTSTTPAQGADWTVSLNFKDNFGLVWITVFTENAICRGLSKVVESVRQTF